ncbi:interferon-induced protein 44-like isoform X2 [Perca fluviatilis]|uniref:interferon-induced protein 44-like isoform X2 n=1 Tax=Perca fluviatilis TaxID=8168 RepID=UPI0019655F61|nr:interferon-induced protein 44-like isoform X2 [Perca fluviatilis]
MGNHSSNIHVSGSYNTWSMPPSRTVSEPWRKISWGDNARDLQYVKEYKPGNKDIKHVRILLYGPDGAGKSSFINSVSSVIQGRGTTPALTSDKSCNGTHETFKIRKEGNPETFCHFVFNDVMDLKDGDGICADDIKLTLKGHVKEGYQFKPSSPLSPGDPGYNPRPSADDQVHVLVCVLSADSAEITDSVLKKMADIREAASELGIPQMAIGTHIDSACPETEKDLKNVYKSQHLKQKVKDFSAAVGVPENYIFPVKNYSDETDINDDVNTLILSALRQMINLGDNFSEKLI